MKLKAALFTAAATLVLAPAAQAYEGLYGAIGAGLSYMAHDRDVESHSGGPYLWDSEADYDHGIGVYTSLGYAYGNKWRTEFEFSYRNNDVRHFAGDGLGFGGWAGGNLKGDISSYGFMANLIRDLGDGPITPYVGVGVGLAHLDASFQGVGPSGILSINDGNNQFAYQGIAGFAIKLAEGLALDIGYRYFKTREAEFTGTHSGIPVTIGHDYANHSAFAGLRWNFGASDAPKVQYKDCWDGSSVPVSASCPPQLTEQQSAKPNPFDIIVYFAYDKSNLTDEAMGLIREAAARARAGTVDRVRVEGNADRSGSSAYNQALSQRRANVVRDALIANGVPADRIDMAAFGEDNPAKPTPDGVREPLNRRTEVRITFR